MEVSIDLILFLVSAVAGLLVALRSAAPAHRKAAFLLLKIVLIGVLAARAGFLYLHADRYVRVPWNAARLTDGGFLVFAGFAATLAATLWHAWRNHDVRHSLVLAVASAFFIWGGGLNVFWLLRTDQIPLPKITLQALDGRPVAIEDFVGKPIVVNLWATWCPPCRREMPLLGTAQQRHADITFLFANQGESGQLVRQYLATQVPLLRNVLLDGAGQFPVHVGSQALPVTLFFSARGLLLGKHVGELSDSDLGREINRLRESGVLQPLASETSPAQGHRFSVPASR